MDRLNYRTLEELGYRGYLLKDAPEKVLQFGEGNFLRAFVDYWFDMANERVGWNGKCVLVQPIPTGLTDLINEQEGLYTLYLRGTENGRPVDRRRVISSVSRCLNPYTPGGFRAMLDAACSDAMQIIVSNTTEAGIVYDPACLLSDEPCSSFPGKLTQVLYARYRAGKSGVVILSCELIDDNGRELKRCVDRYIAQWGLGEGFSGYVNDACTFCSTLVDRIVPGRIRDMVELARMETGNGYHDELIDVGEVFGVWNIEGPAWLEDALPFRRAGLNCPVVPDVTPYKKRKVRILNGAHTGFVPGAYLGGYNIVRDCMADPRILGFMNKMLYEEVIPTLPLDRADLEQFTAAVQDRFNNPYINHELLSITLNSTSKWRARNLPSLLEYIEAKGSLPPCLTMSFAAYIAFYTSGVEGLTELGLSCHRENGDAYLVQDDRDVLAFFAERHALDPAELVHEVMRKEAFWGQDLTLIPGFEDAVVHGLATIRENGALAAFASCL